MPAEPSPLDPLLSLSDDELLARLPKAAALPDAPPNWVQRAVAAWQAPLGARVADAVDGLRRRVEAWLSFDSWATAPLAAGLRSTSSATRQLVFSADGRDVDLRIVPAGMQFTLSGQVLGPDETGTVMLVPEVTAGDPGAARQVPLDALGEFHLAEVQPGRYQLALQLADQDVVLPAFDVGGPIRFQTKDDDAV
jgi:hypothetical protein